ncbi:hypothetical protein B7463_g9990, partial [Scytalidium lignicola]
MNQDLETDIPVNNNNEQQLEEGSEEGFEEESEEGSEEVSEESLEDSFKEDQDKNQTIEETNIQEGVLEEVVMLLKQPTKSTEGSTVRESSRASGKKPAPPLLKPNLEPVQVPRAPSPDLDLDSEPEDDDEQVLMAILREVKIARPDLFYEDKKKLKAYLVQTGTYLIRNEQYEIILDKKGGSYFNRKKTESKKDHEDFMELNAMKKGKFFKGKGKKYFGRKNKKGNSFRISPEELDNKRKNKLCFKYRLSRHMANTYKKDNKVSASVKVEAMRIPRIMDILSESLDKEGLSKEDNSSEEGDYQDLVTVLYHVIKTNADKIVIARILETDSVLMERTRHIRHP